MHVTAEALTVAWHMTDMLNKYWAPLVFETGITYAAIPAQSEKIQDILQDIWKNIGHLTGLQKPILLHSLGIIVSRQYSKSSDVGIYRAGTLLPEIIVTLFTQKHISRLLCASATYFWAYHTQLQSTETN